MTKAPTLTDLTSQYGAQSVVNSNNAAIEAAFENTLSRDGSSPNQMDANLDMNGYSLINVGAFSVDSLEVAGTNLVAATSVPDWEGAWLTATSYAVNDLVREDGSSYICVEAHTSGTFSTDLAASKWELFASKGAAGAGTGDMLAANNLSDLANAATSRTNLGVSIGADVQGFDAGLASIAGLTTAADKMIYTTASDTYAVTDLTAAGRALLDDADASAQRTTLGLGSAAVAALIDDDTMATASATNVPSAESVVAYVASVGGLGVGQAWQNVAASRTAGVSYQNTTGKPIMVVVGGSWNGADATPLEVSSDGASWINVSTIHSGGTSNCSIIVPDDHYYRWNGSAPTIWAELR